MEILSQKYPGLTCLCDQCGALLGHIQENEIYENKYVYCPICKYKNIINYQKGYDGILQIGKIKIENISQEEKENGYDYGLERKNNDINR